MGTVYSIGIDFGTANSCVAYGSYAQNGSELDSEPLRRPEVIPFHNHDTVPTAIHLGDGKQQPPTFGRMAEERGAVDAERLYTGFKLHLGDPERGRDAFLMTKYFLGYLRRRIELFVPLGIENPDERVETIVGHPVQWSADQREATLQAAIESGFPNVRVEEESLAALYCHVFDERGGRLPDPGSYVLTVDMGGGTTDFAFLHMPDAPGGRPESIPVHPATSEGKSYGGRHLDRLLLQYFSRSWSPEIVNANAPFLIREVRRFKEAFSSHLSEGASQYESKIPVGEELALLKLNRDEFEGVCGEYIKYFEVLLAGALEEATLKPEQVTDIILTGGHSRWYFVERTIANVFPHLAGKKVRRIHRHSHPEQSVARGLAYDPLVRSSKKGAIAPVRRATHAVWLHVPAEPGADGQPSPAAAAEPMLLIPRGQVLPFKTPAPIKFKVEQLVKSPQATQVRVQFLSGHRRMPLADRVASFQRGFWEQVTKSLGSVFRIGGQQRDQFEIEVDMRVDEHEMIQAEMIVKRMVGGRVADVQKEKMQVSAEAGGPATA